MIRRQSSRVQSHPIKWPVTATWHSPLSFSCSWANVWSVPGHFSRLQGFSSWLFDENSRMREIFNSKFPPKCKCHFCWTTNWKIPVLVRNKWPAVHHLWQPQLSLLSNLSSPRCLVLNHVLFHVVWGPAVVQNSI